MICSSVCLSRFIVWSFLKAKLQFTLDQFNGATSRMKPIRCLLQKLTPATPGRVTRAIVSVCQRVSLRPSASAQQNAMLKPRSVDIVDAEIRPVECRLNYL